MKNDVNIQGDEIKLYSCYFQCLQGTDYNMSHILTQHMHVRFKQLFIDVILI